ncbi:MAG: DNA cytosine methyltransferase [Rhizobiales bacterium]|nr:DNA cytosine methyltransferase [Hyphomicrobiales bacterium]
MVEKPTTIDLFCGAGGITEGFREAGFQCLFANDMNEHAMATFYANHPSAMVALASVEDLEPDLIRQRLGLRLGDLDCLVGGPPCQGFSINAPDRFLDDPRNSMFRHYVRFVDEFQPKTLLIENVPGMLSLAGGLVAKQILRELVRRGYAVSYRILFAAHYGVPQERWRLIILGSRLGCEIQHPSPITYATARANFTGGRSLIYKLHPTDCGRLPSAPNVKQAIGDLPGIGPGGGAERMDYDRAPASAYACAARAGSEAVFNHVAPRIASVNLERLRYIKPGGSWRDIPHDLLPSGMQRARRSDHTRRYGRLHPDGLSGTVMTKIDPHWGPAFHFEQDRTLTVREAARLQSFPDRYRFLGPRGAQYEQVGNAVPVLMAKAIAGSIRGALSSQYQTSDAAAG